MNTASRPSKSRLNRRLAAFVVLAASALGLASAAQAASILPAETRTASPYVGTPNADAAAFDGMQHYTGNCAIRSQELVLEQLTGREYDEDALLKTAVERGWCLPDGGTTDRHNIGKLLELHGLEVHRYERASLEQISGELAQGHKVIVIIDADELWYPEKGEGDFEANHAFVVIGTDDTDPLDVQVIVADSGNGQVNAYPRAQFLGAWQDGNFYMVTAQIPTQSSKLAAHWSFVRVLQI